MSSPPPPPSPGPPSSDVKPDDGQLPPARLHQIDPALVAASEALSSGFAAPQSSEDAAAAGTIDPASAPADGAVVQDHENQQAAVDGEAYGAAAPADDDQSASHPHLLVSHDEQPVVDHDDGSGGLDGLATQEHHHHDDALGHHDNGELDSAGALGEMHDPSAYHDASGEAGPSTELGGDIQDEPQPVASSGVVPLIRQKKANQRGGPGGGSVNETGQRKPASQLRNEGKPPKGVTECASCGLKESPEWRKGESGLKDLCNACGLRHARLVAKRAGKIRPRKKKAKNPPADSGDAAESSKRGVKRARTTRTDGGVDGVSLNIPAGAATSSHGLDPSLGYSHYGHPAQHPGYYHPAPNGLQPGMQGQQQHQQHQQQQQGAQSSPHQPLPPIDAAPYGPLGGGFYNPNLHPQLQQQQHLVQGNRIASASPTTANFNNGANGQGAAQTGTAPGAPNGGGGGSTQLPPLGGGPSPAPYAHYPAGPYFPNNGMRPFDPQQMQQMQQQHPMSLGQYPYYPAQMGGPGGYDAQLQSNGGQPPQQQQQQQQQPMQGGFYAPPPFPNYGYQMQPGHFPDGYASAQAAAAAAAVSSGAGAAVGGGGAGGGAGAQNSSQQQAQQQQQQQQQQQTQESEERGGPAGAPRADQQQQQRAQEGTA